MADIGLARSCGAQAREKRDPNDLHRAGRLPGRNRYSGRARAGYARPARQSGCGPAAPTRRRPSIKSQVHRLEVRQRRNILTSTLDCSRKRWLALIVLCLGELMIVLDTTIVNVALPSIREDLAFTETSLVWVVNAYMLTYGGFLLLGGRLGDLFGQRRLFLLGITLFTLASLACGLAGSQGLLVAARAVQGLGGAVVSAIALSLIMNLFSEPADRAKAMGIFGFVCAGGGSIMAAFSLGISAKMVMRFGIRVPLAAGLALTAAGLALF